MKRGWELEKTHSIARLLSIAEDYHIKVAISDEDIVFIDSIYRGRCPAEVGLLPSGEPSEADAKKAVNLAERILSETKLSLKIP